MDQYGINCLAKAYEALPRQLADNSGNDPSKAISKLLAAHAAMEGNLAGMTDGRAFTQLLHLLSLSLTVNRQFCSHSGAREYFCQINISRRDKE